MSNQIQIELVSKVVCDLHQELVKNRLVVWTAGNVSQRLKFDDGSPDLFVIKPSGVSYDDLKPDDMVVCNLDGNVVAGSRKPSSDTAAHAYVYRNMPEVGGVVHTHSNYATAWAARGEAIPCVLTAQADEFGGEMLRVRGRAAVAAGQHFAAIGDTGQDGLHRRGNGFAQDLRRLVLEVGAVDEMLFDALL